MKAPTCPLCSKEHWSWEPHAGIGPVHNSAKSWGTVTPTVTPDESVTPVTPRVTVTDSARNAAAARQARYRQRKAKS